MGNIKNGGKAMLVYEIPGRDNIEIKNIVFDYNGTIAVDGRILEVVRELLTELGEYVKIHILTADTFGTVKKECSNINVEVLTFPKENTSKFKKDIVEGLGGENTICVGNGFNDIEMFKKAAISIGVIEGEGASGKLLLHADIVTRSIIEAIEIILNKDKMKATLRN